MGPFSDQFGPKVLIQIFSANADLVGALFMAFLTRKLKKIFQKISVTRKIPYSVKILVNADIPFLLKESG